MKRNITKHENWFLKTLVELEKCLEVLFEIELPKTQGYVADTAKRLVQELSINMLEWTKRKELTISQEEYHSFCSLIFCGNSMSTFILKRHSGQRITQEAHFWNHEVTNLKPFFMQNLDLVADAKYEKIS